MKSLRPIILLAVLETLVTSNVTHAQVGGAPAAPGTLWNFLGIPQGIQKLRGATTNRRGNHPGREPKPALKAIADPKNLESKDKAIKKAAEVKQAEDLKKQKIKAVKYLTKIGCGCYDVDGGVTEALVASAGDCTEDVRYETIKAITEAAEGECCSKCGKVCCCNKDVLTKLAAMAYERDDSGCYIEPSERVREAAAEALEVCCPNETLPIIIEEKIVVAPKPESSDEGEEVKTPEYEAESDAEALPYLDSDTDEEDSPEDDTVLNFEPKQQVRQIPWNSANDFSTESPSELHSGVVVHVSNPHQLAHVRFCNADVQPPVGSMVIVYKIDNEEPLAIARLHVVESFPGSANVTASKEALAQVARGNLIVCPTQGCPSELQQTRSQKQAAVAPQLVEANIQHSQTEETAEVTHLEIPSSVSLLPRSFAQPLVPQPKALVPQQKGHDSSTLVIATDSVPILENTGKTNSTVGQIQHTMLQHPSSILPGQFLR